MIARHFNVWDKDDLNPPTTQIGAELHYLALKCQAIILHPSPAAQGAAGVKHGDNEPQTEVILYL